LQTMRRILRCGTARVLKKWNPNTNSSRSISSRANSSPTTLVPRSPLLQMKATAITPPPGGQPYRRRRGYAVELARKTVALGKQADHSLPFSSIINSIAVGHILELKQDKMVWEVREDQTVIDAIRVMCEKNSGSVVVYGCETQLPVGILSRIDCMRKLVLKNQFARETPISKVMATEVACVTPAFTLGQCLEILAQSSNLRYLPVVDDIGDPEDGDNRVIGILGQRDVLNWLVRSFLDATDADILDDSDRVSAGDVLNRTGEPLGVCISSDSTVYDALDCMANNNATYTMVNKGEGIEGIFTGTDYLREIILPAKKSKGEDPSPFFGKSNG